MVRRTLTLVLLLTLAGLVSSASVGQGSVAKVVVRVSPSHVTAGDTVYVIAGVKPKGAKCKASIGRGGTVVATAPARKAVTGSLAWHYHVPVSAKTQTWLARVSCGGAGSAAASFWVAARAPAPPPTTAAKVVVVKSGISTRQSSIGSEFAGYGMVLQNLSADQDALDVTVTTNILDASGGILKTEVDTYHAIPAATTYYAGGNAIWDGTTPAAKLEITVQVGKSQKASIPSLPGVSNLRVTDDYLGLSVAGEVANPYTQTLSSLARITFVLFDGAGNVVGGGYTYVPADVPPGGRIGFDTSSYSNLSASQVASVQASVEPEVK